MIGRLPSGLVNAEPRTEVTPDWYIEHLLADAERFAAVLETEPLDTPVPACPGWDLSRLAEHIGQIHRWANFCAGQGRRPSDEEARALESYDAAIAAEWFRVGATTLADTLRLLDPDAPGWHPFPAEQVNRFWPRRMAHETAIHRWDAERAVGSSATIDPALASDGIDEYFEIVAPRLIAGGRADLPAGSLHVHCTDVTGEWLVWTDDDGYQMVRAHQKGDAALRGPAAAILLKLWGRQADDAAELNPVGDESVLDAWLAIGGV
jgi:uncharacterized protein (TIGR03083 family)